MDLYCPRCGEPWENDTFHEVAAENKANYTPPAPFTVGAVLAHKNGQPGRTYAMVMSDFWKRGCEALGVPRCEKDPSSKRAEFSSALHDILGSDSDGIAAMLEDAEYFGEFDS